MTPDEHTPQVHTTAHSAWVVCACGWRSLDYREQHGAQLAWVAHLTVVQVLAELPLKR